MRRTSAHIGHGRAHSRELTPSTVSLFVGGLDVSAVMFRRVAWAEAVAYVALVIGAAAQYLADGPEAVAVLGPVHGVVYLGYAAAVMARSRVTGWTGQTQLVLLGAGILPLGTIWAERWARTRRRC